MFSEVSYLQFVCKYLYLIFVPLQYEEEKNAIIRKK
jgi:hypothetical protein